MDGNDVFGFSVTNLGDLDGDGVTDIAVGAILDDDGDDDAGAVWILFLNGGSAPNVTLPTLTDITPNEAFPGETVTVILNGENFTSDMTVNINETGVTVSNVNVASANLATAQFDIANDSSSGVPGVKQVSVTTIKGTSNSVGFTVRLAKFFIFNCEHSMPRGFFGLEKLTMNVGDVENCVLQLTNHEPGKSVEISSLLRNWFRSVIKIEPAGNFCFQENI